MGGSRTHSTVFAPEWRRRAPLVCGLPPSTNPHLEAPTPVCLTKQGERPDPYVGPRIFVSIRVADAGRGRPRPGGCGTGRTAMRSSKICVESGLRAPVVDPANFPRDTRRSTRPSRPSGRRSRTSQERPNPGWIKDRPPHHRVAPGHMGITALDPSIHATRDPAFSRVRLPY